jgi:tetratricopeptide (TPR) repeat protein
MSTNSRAYDIWLRKPEEAQQLLESKRADLDGDGLSLLSWLVLTNERDDKKAEEIAHAAVAAGGDTRFATAALAEVHKWRGDFDRAAEIVRSAREKYPMIPWYALTLADVLKDGGRIDEAETLLESVVTDSQLRRHALKRLSKWAVDRGDKVRGLKYQTELIALAPDYLVYASDYTLLAALRLDAGDSAGAREILQRGASIYPRNSQIKEMLHQQFGEIAPEKAPNIPPVDEKAVGARRVPIRTNMITLRSGILPVIKEATAGQLQPDDILALSESPASAGQGRMIPLELISPEGMAKQLSKFVGKIGPLHSPAGMQGAILEAGRAKVLLGAAAGAAGKLVGKRGWFYRVAGPGAAMIDDVAAALPPHDHHLLFGPGRPDKLSEDLAAALGCHVCVVDANHLTGAWVVGASAGVDRKWVEKVLSDNPAGNEDEQTPIVLIRKI